MMKSSKYYLPDEEGVVSDASYAGYVDHKARHGSSLNEKGTMRTPRLREQIIKQGSNSLMS